MQEPEEPSLLDRIEVLPEEMQTELLSYLEYNEVLRLRRVSNRFRHLAEGHLRRRLPSSYLSINLDVDGPLSLTQFKSFRFSDDLIIPKVSFFYLGDDDNNLKTWKKFLTSQDLDWFMETYAPHVKQLNLQFLQLPICSSRQLKFLESFTNLEVFECDLLDLTSVDLWGCYFHNEEMLIAPVFVPNSFKSLKKLRISEVKCTNPSRNPTTSELNRFWDFTKRIMETTCLEEFWDPVEKNIALDLENLAVRLKTIMDIIKSWNKLDKPPKTFDLNSFSELVDLHKDIDVDLFRSFFELCAKSNIHFEEVEDSYFVSFMGDEFSRYVKTMISPYPGDLVTYDYSNLEVVEFRIAEEKYFGTGPLRCPKLRGLSLHFEQLENSEDHIYDRRIVQTLFHDTKHPNLTSLFIQFDEEIPSLVNPSDIVSSCGNLTYLCLHNCTASSPDFVELWKGLRCLEHLKLSGCANLDDDSFIGDNLDEPAICQLKKLKYLELLGLSHMPGVTDKILTDAIRHIKLRCFRLTSARCNLVKEDYETFEQLLSPHALRFQNTSFSLQNEGTVSNISPDGILSLKSGVFAETIEQLDLSELHIEGLPNDCLQAIQKEFRSWRF